MYLLPFLARCIGHLLPFSCCYIVISSFAVLAGSVAPLWTCITGLEDDDIVKMHQDMCDDPLSEMEEDILDNRNPTPIYPLGD